MNKIDKLIKELCPNGVEFKTLGELGEFENIGVDKKIIEGQKPIMLLNFMDIMRNKHITKDTLTMEVTASDSKIEKCDIKKHDIFITPSSETRDEIGFTAVVDEDIPNAVYSYHIMRFRLFEKNDVTPYFISYLFEANDLRNQIFKASKGLTRFGLSAKDFAKLSIPIPPLPIQQEIVKILDKFTALEAELQAELEARRKQYEYYREKLLTFSELENIVEGGVKPYKSGGYVEWKTLGEVCLFRNGKGHEKDIVEDGDYIVVNSKFVSTEGKVVKYSDKQISPLYIDDILMVMSDLPNGKALAKTYIVSKNNKYTLNQRIGALTAKYKERTNPKFLYYILNRNKQLLRYDNGADQTNLRKDDILTISIPIPPLTEQERIVSILDKFEEMVNKSLPEEIEARRKQYEYYREKLLTFGTAGFPTR